MRYIKYAFLCFLLTPLAASANKYMIRAKNTKAEVESLGLVIKNITTDNANRLKAKNVSMTHKYEIWTDKFEPCKPVDIGITLFIPPKGMIFSAELDERGKDIYTFRVKDGEADGLLISISCPNNETYAFPLVD